MFSSRPSLVLLFGLSWALIAPAQQRMNLEPRKAAPVPDLQARPVPTQVTAGDSGKKEQPSIPVPSPSQRGPATPTSVNTTSSSLWQTLRAAAGVLSSQQPAKAPVKVKVPAVEGKSQEMANHLLAADRLQATFQGDRGGVATQQNPLAGQWADPGSTVTVTLAFPQVIVPPLFGMTAEEAQSRLSVDLLNLGSVAGDNAQGSTVAAQSIVAGREVPRGTAIAITLRAPAQVPSGQPTTPAGIAPAPAAPQGPTELPPPQVAVPSLLKKSRGGAVTALGSVKLNVGSVSGPQNGVVASQYPLPGVLVESGSQVSFSLQLETVSVPNVIDDQQSEATNRLKVFQLKPQIQKAAGWDPHLAHVVLSQAPAAGTEVNIGSIVKLVLGNVTPPPLPWWKRVPAWGWVGAGVGALALAFWKLKPSAQPTRTSPQPAAACTFEPSAGSAKTRFGQSGDPKVRFVFGLRSRVPAARYRFEEEPAIRRKG
jgi:beta-lactam-binding protein with PASTA domain